MSEPRPAPTKWELLMYPEALVVVSLVMLYAVNARQDLGQPLAGITIGLAIFGLVGACWLSWLWWRRFGRGA